MTTETLIRNKADLDAAFAPKPDKPKGIVQYEIAIVAIAAAINAMNIVEGITITATTTPSKLTKDSFGAWRWDGGGITLYANGDKYPYHMTVSLNEYQKTTGWRSTPSGRYYVSVGDWGSKKLFPQRKNGSFDVKGIAEILAMRCFNWKRAAVLELLKEANADLYDLAGMRKRLGLSEYTDVIRATQDTGLVYLKLNDIIAIEPEKAEAVILFLREQGFRIG